MNSNGIITAPVSIDDVKTVLGITSNDLAVLCSSPKINMWAKYKPVKYKSAIPINESNMASVTFGIGNIPYWTSTSKMVGWFNGDSDSSPENVPSSADMWIYELPAGGADSPYRLSDFKNYFHGAILPLRPLTDTAFEESLDGNISVNFPLGIEDDQHRDLRLSDIIQNFITSTQRYFGVIFRNGSTYYIITSSVVMTDENAGSINFIDTNAVLPGKTWSIIPIVSSVEISGFQSGSDIRGIFVPIIPAVSLLTITKKSKDFDVERTLTAYYSHNTDKSIHIVLVLKNNSDYTVDVQRIDCEITDAGGASLGSQMIKSADAEPLDAGESLNINTTVAINSIAYNAYQATVTAVIDDNSYIAQALISIQSV